MNSRRNTGWIALFLSSLAAGCNGLGVKPMPDRLGEEQQLVQDYGWAHLLLLGDEVDRQALMDAVLMKQLWHRGVDSLRMVSERQVDDVLIVMESRFDRASPDGDEFVITFYDAAGMPFRAERYSGDELDAAMALYMSGFSHPPDGSDGDLSPGELDQQELARLELESRLARMEEIFPEPEFAVPDGRPTAPGYRP